MTIYNDTKEHYCITDFHIADLLNRTFCVFDFEATGIDHASEQVIQVGAVMVSRSGISYQHTYDALVKPPKPIPPEIERFTSITNSMVAGAADFPQIYESFKAFVGDSVLVAQCGFEYDFFLLDNECARHKTTTLANERLDTKVMYAALHPEEEGTFSTDFLVRKYDIPTDDVVRHTALGDSIIISRILAKLLREYEKTGRNDLSVREELIIRKYVPAPIA